MTIGFQYIGFKPDENLKVEAEETLERIQDVAPIGSTVVALLDYDGKSYACSIDVFVRTGSILASANSVDALESIRRAEEIVIEKLRKVRETRFFTRESEVLTRGRRNHLEPELI